MSDRDRNTTSSGADQDEDRDLRRRAIDAYDRARDSASDAGRRAGSAIGEAPLVALGAGLAAGAFLAAILPTSRRERELLAPVGGRITGAARDAADAARQAGSDKLKELGLTPEAVVDKASDAAKASAQAAVSRFKDEATER